MGNKFSSGKHAIAECDVCGRRYKLKELKPVPWKNIVTNTMACPECWDPSHPQLMLGMYPVGDPQAVRNPRPDNSYAVSGLLGNGLPGGGSRVFQWGWNPVGGGDAGVSATPNYLVAATSVGTVAVVTT